MPTETWRTELPCTAEQLYAWHAVPSAFARLTAPRDRVQVLSREGGLEVGARLRLRVQQGPLPMTFVTVHTAHEPGRGFTDEQEGGPFAQFRHEHRFEPLPDGRCALVDRVTWKVPLGGLGQAVGGWWVARQLERMFAWRHGRTLDDMQRLAPYRGLPRLRVAITGASGLVGRALCELLEGGGHEVLRLGRRAEGPGEARFDPSAGVIDAAKLEGCDAVVHLAGEPIAEKRWTEEQKRRIRDSRVVGTRMLCEALAGLARKPSVLISGSATGVYGDTGERWVDESSPAGTGFLAEVGEAWEAEAQAARDAGIRLVTLRTGLVLSAGGGLLDSLLPLYRWSLGGVVGSGRQGQPWIHLDDLVAMIHWAIREPGVEGPLNGVAPGGVDQRTFARVLGAALWRPTLAPLPAFAARGLFGELGQALLLEGQRVRPAKAEALGFRFRYPELAAALDAEV